MINFSNLDFPYYEFPDGINLTLLDDNNQSSTVVSNTAILYNKTDLIDLRGNVILTTATNDTLFTEQLSLIYNETQIDHKAISPGDLDLIQLVDTPEEVIEILDAFYKQYQLSPNF